MRPQGPQQQEIEQTQSTIKSIAKIIIVGTANVLESLAMFPLERVRLHKVVHGKLSSDLFWNLHQLVKTEGVLTLWKGFRVSFIVAYLREIIFNFLYKLISQFHSEFSKIDSFLRFKVSLLLKKLVLLFSQALVYPLIAVQTRLSADRLTPNRVYEGMSDCINKSIEKANGDKLFKGFCLYICRAFIGKTFGEKLFSFLKHIQSKLKCSTSHLSLFLIFHFSQMITQVIFYPLNCLEKLIVTNKLQKLSSLRVSSLFEGVEIRILECLLKMGFLLLYDKLKSQNIFSGQQKQNNRSCPTKNQ